MKTCSSVLDQWLSLLSPQEKEKAIKNLKLSYVPRGTLDIKLTEEASFLNFKSNVVLPSLYISHKRGRSQESCFWLLIFILHWHTKGHTYLPLKEWEFFIETTLKEKREFLSKELHANSSFLRKYQELAQKIQTLIGNLKSLDLLLTHIPDLISLNSQKTPLLWRSEQKDAIVIQKTQNQEDAFLKTLKNLIFSEDSSSYHYNIKEANRVLKALQLHLAPQSLSTEQSSLISKSLQSSLVILSGGPGTGKTTTVSSLLRVLIALWQSSELPPRIMLCAPTGLACNKLRDSIEKNLKLPFIWKSQQIDSLIPQEIYTLSRLLKHNKQGKPNHSSLDEFFPYDIILIDEASMIPLVTLHHLLKKIPSQTKLILVGDPYQLPPIEMGAPFNDLVSLSQKKGSPLKKSSVILKKNFRFQSQPILQTLSQYILEGKSQEFLSVLKNLDSEAPVKYLSFEDSFSLAKKHLLPLFWDYEENGQKMHLKIQNLLKKQEIYLGTSDIITNSEDNELLQPLTKTIILTAQKVGMWGRDNLNAIMLREYRETLRILKEKQTTPLKGVPIMVTKNRPLENVVNGERGYIFYIDTTPYACFPKKNYWASFPLSYLEDSYEVSFVQTVHKSQGSEYEYVILILKQDSALLSRELLYTSLTRSKNQLFIIGEDSLIDKSIKNSSQRFSNTYTLLK